MKKNLLFVLAFLVAGFTQAQVSIDWSVEEILEPTNFETANNGTTPFSTKFVLKNNGPDSAMVGDTILYQMVIRNSSNQVLVALPNGSLYFRVLDKKLLSGDTIHQSFGGTLNSGAVRSFAINYSVLSYITNRSRGLALETAGGGTTGNNTKIKGMNWLMAGGFGVGVTDIDATNSINVYPTIVDKFVTIDILVKHVNTTPEVSLFDLQGKEISHQTLSNNTEKVDISSLVSGVYIMKVTNGSEVYSTKIVKN